jgi:hypothetical protein
LCFSAATTDTENGLLTIGAESSIRRWRSALH